MRALVYLSLVAVDASAACSNAGTSPGGGSSAPADLLVLKPGRYVFHLGREVHVGTRLRCRTRDGAPAGGGGVEPLNHGVGSSSGFSALTKADGRVVVICPAHPGTV